MKNYKILLLIFLGLVVVLTHSACSERNSGVERHTFALAVENLDDDGQISPQLSIEGEEVEGSFTDEYRAGQTITLEIDPGENGRFLGWRKQGAAEGDYYSTKEKLEYTIEEETYLIAEIDYTERIDSIEIVGDDEVEIPAIDDDSKRVEYEIVPYDEDGEVIEELELEFNSIDEEEVIVMGNTLRILSYQAKNYDSPVELKVEADGISATKEVDLIPQPTKPHSIEFINQEFALNETEQLYLAYDEEMIYEAVIRDQYNQIINDNISLDIVSSSSGIEINDEELMIGSDVEPQELILEASTPNGREQFNAELKKAQIFFSVEDKIFSNQPISDAKANIRDDNNQKIETLFANEAGEFAFEIGLGAEIMIELGGTGYKSNESPPLEVDQVVQNLGAEALEPAYQVVTKPDSNDPVTGGDYLGALEYAKTESNLYLKLRWQEFAPQGPNSDHLLILIDHLENEIGYNPYYQYDSYTTGWDDNSYNVGYQNDFFDLNFITWSWISEQGDFNFEDGGAHQVLELLDDNSDNQLTDKETEVNDVKADISFRQDLDRKIYYFRIPYQAISQGADKNSNYQAAIVFGKEGFTNITDTLPQEEDWVIENPSISDNERDVKLEYGAELE